MSYADMAALYANPEQRARIDMCTREQGAIFTNDGRPDIAALGRDTVAGYTNALDAVAAAVITGPNGAGLDDDPALLSAVQAVWPTVAAALHPQEPA